MNCADSYKYYLRYDEAVKFASQKKGKGSLEDLEKWYRCELKTSMLARDEVYLTGPELVKLVRTSGHDDNVAFVDWKLTRGKWRPRLLDFAKAHESSSVEAVSRDAFKMAGDGNVDGAIKKLSELKGVGVATATAVLAAAVPSLPFMSDELMQSLLGKKEYTLPAYHALLAKTEAAVSKLAKHSDIVEGGWTAEALEKAVWAAALLTSVDATGNTAAAAKRKQDATGDADDLPTARRKRTRQ